MRWQKRARIVIAIAAMAFAVVVAFAFKGRRGAAAPASIARTDPNAVIESTGGSLRRFNLAHEEVRIEYDRQVTYADGATRLVGVKVTTDDRGGRSFSVSGREGRVADKESSYELNGDVRLATSDGFTARTEHATYNDKEAIVHAPGPVQFGNDRMTGSGMGLAYDKNADVLTILDQARMRMAPDANGAGAADITAGAAIFSRRDKIIRFDRGVTVERGDQTIHAENGFAHLSADEKRLERLDLHMGARITAAHPMPGSLRLLSGRDMALDYGADGDALQHVQVDGEGVIEVAGEQGKPGRQIAANTISIGLAPDGSTPTSVTARDGVQLTLPAEEGAAARTVRAAMLDATGEPGRGLTRARFDGNVEYRERGADVDRLARSARLDAALGAAMSGIDEATFTGNARFADAKMFGTSATLRYVVASGGLDLSGSEPAIRVPHVNNDQITVDATHIAATLAGPTLHATGNVKSVLLPAKKDAPADGSATKLPSMLKQDQPANVAADALNYDGGASKAVYTGGAQLWQADTSVKGDTIVIDDKTGDLTASGSVTTTSMLEQESKAQDGKTPGDAKPGGNPAEKPGGKAAAPQKERSRSTGTAKDFKYEDALRRATYTGNAHISGSQGDMTADRIELYLTPSGDELERAEGYDNLTLRETTRKTTGVRLTYTASNETYVVTGKPVTVVDECGRVTTGATLTFAKGADTIVVDGNQRIRTETKGGEKCQ